MKSKYLALMFVMIFLVSMVSASVETTYTPTSKTDCNELNECKTTIYSSTTYVQEDNQWKHYTEARSLKGKGFEEEFIEVDTEYPVEVVDFNATHGTFDLHQWAIFNEDVRLRLWQPNQTKVDNFLANCEETRNPQGKYTGQCNAILNDNEGNKYGIWKKYYKEFYDMYSDEYITFNLFDLGDERITREIELGSILEFGPNSTTIVLDWNGVIGDSWLQEQNPGTNYGTNSVFRITRMTHVPSNPDNRGYLNYNVSSIPNNVLINSAISSLYLSQNQQGSSALPINQNVTMFRIYSSYTENESTITWNNQPASGSEYNASITNSKYVHEDDPQNLYLNWTITEILQQVKDNSEDELRLHIEAKSSQTGISTPFLQFNTKENAGADTRPLLYITYTELEPTVTLNIPTVDQGFIPGDEITFNCSATQDVSDTGGIINLTLIINAIENITVTNSSIDQNYLSLSNTINASNYGLGIHNYTCEAYDSEGYSDIANERDFVVADYRIEDETFDSNVVETQESEFNINVTINVAEYSNAAAQLYYEGTPTLASKVINGDNYYFTATQQIPLTTAEVTENKSFYWNLTLVNATDGALTSVVVSTNNHTVEPIFVRVCGEEANVNVTAYNWTVYDEENLTKINSTFETTFEYYEASGDGSITKNHSYQNLVDDKTNYALCVQPGVNNYTIDLAAEYTSTGYLEREKFLVSATLSNNSVEENLYLLADTTGVKFFFDVLQGFTPVQNADITIAKFYTGLGQFINVGFRQTDGSGEFIEYLELDKTYRYTVVKDGVVLGIVEEESTCATAPCEQTIQLGSTTQTPGGNQVIITSPEQLVSFAKNVQYTLKYNKTSKLVTFTFVDTTGSANYFRLKANYINYDQQGGEICNEQLFASSGTLTCDVSAVVGNFKASGFISRSPEKLVDFIIESVNEIADVVGENGLVVALFLIITIGLVGVWNPGVGVMLLVFSMFVIQLTGMASFGLNVIGIVFIIGLIIMWRMRT